MSITNQQLAQTPAATDFPFHNYSGSDIAANIAVALDDTKDIATNSSGIGVKLPAASGDPCVGVTQEVIPAGGYGRVRCFGPIAQMTAKGANTAGAWVMAEITTGNAIAATTGKTGIGIALNASTSDGDLLLVMLSTGYNA